ncbi:MAG: IS66 family transposase [Cyclobacteriaceae bacterium]|nr:IS66 family transposase [Cyclobacteriaceae bacterium]
MLITDEIFQAFLVCENKSYLKLKGDVGSQREFTEWERNRFELFKQKCLDKIRSNFGEYERPSDILFPQAIENIKCNFIVDFLIKIQELQSHIDAFERLKTPENVDIFLIPIRFIPNEKIIKKDKLLLAFDAIVLSTTSVKISPFGKIMHGVEKKIVKIELASLIEVARTIINKITAQHANPNPPQLILNKHCPECEFQLRCRQIAIEKDELTLLGMSQKERKRQHNKGIFSVTQLSYTFRARRRPKKLAFKKEKYSHALKALAIRENKIHIAGKLEFNMKGNPVFLDVEGNPDQDFYYLIGLRFKRGDSCVQYSFWANEISDEKEIWFSFIKIIMKIVNPQLIYYGNYEKLFLNRMKERYSLVGRDALLLDKLISESVNILSVIYARIYFPTYSNNLKDIARYLGFQWSENTASGLKTLIWRSQWESSKDTSLKQKIITYNAEDCEALEKVTKTVSLLYQKQTDTANSTDNSIVYTDYLKKDNPYHLGRNKFLIPEMEYINQSAYWDYQRDKIYVKSSQQLKRASKKIRISRARDLPINDVVDCQPPIYCPKCKATDIRKWEKTSKIVYDLKIDQDQASIKRWVVKYNFHRYRCYRCRATFYSQQKPWTRSKFGSGFLAYIIYQNIELRISQQTIAKSLNQLFGFNLNLNMYNEQKTRAAKIYKETYDGILHKIVHGKLIHVDETTVSIKGETAYVWVFTSLEEVVYLYKETREGDFLQELLHEFNGVLVSDFYSAYDSVNCPQQKCLIHLIRDLNDDLVRNPFDEELKSLIREFTMLLKPMIETVDRHGLKAIYLRNHKPFVENFYKKLSNQNYNSEATLKYKKRFEKYHNKLFTFLDYDGIPWNNNNAEHTIKAFAMLRKVIGGTSTENGMREYLTLFSICETCKYKGVSFLDFLRSGETDIDVFIKNSVTKAMGGVPDVDTDINKMLTRH